MNSNQPLDVVNILNNNYYNNTKDDEHVPFEYRSNGYYDLILFNDFVLWSSYCDGYEYTEDGTEEIPLIETVERLYKEHYEKIISYMHPNNFFISTN